MLPIVFFALDFAGAAFNVIAYSAVHILSYAQIHNLPLASTHWLKEIHRILVSGSPHIHLLDPSPIRFELCGYPPGSHEYLWGTSSTGNLWTIPSKSSAVRVRVYCASGLAVAVAVGSIVPWADRFDLWR